MTHSSKWFPDKRYAVIYADPPWRFKSYSAKGGKRSPDRHYKTMTLDDIKALHVHRLADKNACTLLMWAVMPMLPEALEVIKAWGFEFKTVGFVWMKQRSKAATLFTDLNDIFAGMGYWTRSNAEICIIATRGNPHRIHADVKQAILSPRREHSRKPAEIYDRIERLVAGPYIELFARNRRKGWDSWGNQVGKFK